MTEEQLRTKVRETIEKVLKEGEEAQPDALAKKMEEETLHEWKERTMYQTLMEKWCK